ncbi:MAG TPA: hypothetical protein P5294_10375 [Smithellaceae bacterium]|nr:hypothetical protein [Smithellaceae bacterium]HRS90084.1 hypothetical protein [Smithellaceae bacterium]HRV26934.1 hypothetical protein [Smithellaceae bacterium]
MPSFPALSFGPQMGVISECEKSELMLAGQCEDFAQRRVSVKGER